MKSWLTGCLLFWATLSPAMAATVTPEATIIAHEQAALALWESGDPSGFLQLAADDVVYFDPFLSQRLDGKAALTTYYEKLRGKIHADHYQMLNPKVQLLGAAAVLTFNFISTNAKGSHYWNCTEVYRQTASGWQIIQTHWSFTKAP